MPFNSTGSGGNKVVPLYGGGQVPNPANVIAATSAPPAAVANKPTDAAIGSIWINVSTGNSYQLVQNTYAAGAVWTLLGGAAAAVATITGDSGGALSPSSGNISILGTANQITTTGSGSTLTLSLPATLVAPGSITATTGNITATAGNVVGLEGNFSGINVTFAASPILQSSATTGAAPSGSTGALNLMDIGKGVIMEQFILGAGQTIIAPRMSSTGLLTSLDLTASEGAEYNFGAARNNSPFAFTIGTSPAFFIELAVNSADVSGLDPFIVGFRKVQANDATFTNYTDFAGIGARATTATDVCVIQTDLNNAGEVITNTTTAWTDGQTKTFKVLVSAAGVVTYTINGVAPAVTAAFTFDSTDVVVPFIRHLFGATTPAALNWVSLRIGFQ